MDKVKIQEDLAIIKQIMQESRQSVTNIGINLVVWGGIVIICLLFTYYSMTHETIISEALIWGIGFSLAWAFELRLYIKNKKKNHDSTFSGNILSRLWLTILISMMIIGIFGELSGAISGGAGSGVIAVLLAIGYIVTGTIMNSGWVKLLGIGWWLGSILIFYTTVIQSILIWVVLMIALQFIPGVVLFVQEKKKSLIA
ncbi:MAG: hypothetical protein KAK01_11565 [Candidatus Marinimicrobia bacterium]|nr:hypothetical protein [Candidatus Neomarinimicrobiota bacterium]